MGVILVTIILAILFVFSILLSEELIGLICSSMLFLIFIGWFIFLDFTTPKEDTKGKIKQEIIRVNDKITITITEKE